MRHDSWRRDPASYPLRGQLHPRFIDVDIWQHLNNAALIAMHGESVQQALRSVWGADAWRGGDPMLAAVGSTTDFLAEAYYPAPLTWAARVRAGDDGRARIATALFQSDRCVGLHDTVVAAWRDGAPTAMSAAQRAALDDAGITADADGASPATHHEPPPTPARFPWHTRVALRFGDADARRVPGDFFLARCAEQMRVEFMTRVWSTRGQDVGGMMVAHVGLRWLHRDAATAPGGHWDVGCGVAHLGERSVAVRGAMFDGDRCVAICDSVMVAIDPATRRSMALPATAHSMLMPYRLGATAD